jgi:tetratricopeptide (TPR) repeat protein
MESSEYAANTEIQVWYQKANTLADNLLYFQETGVLPVDEFCQIVRKICQSQASQQPFVNPFADSEAKDTIYFLDQFIQYAMQYGENTKVMIPMLADLVQSGTQTTSDFVQYLVEEITTGIQQENEELETELGLEQLKHDIEVMPETAQVFENINSYCLGYTVYRECKKAVLYGERAVAMAENLFPENDIRIGDSLKNLALAYFYNGEEEKALPLIEEAYEISQRQEENHKAETTEIQLQYGVVLQGVGEYEKAEQQYFKVLKDQKSLFGEQHPYVAKTLGNLSHLYATLAYPFEEQIIPLLQSISILENYKQTHTPKNKNDHDYYEVIMDLVIGCNNAGFEFYEAQKWEESYTYYSKSCDNMKIFYKEGKELSTDFIDLYYENLEALQEATKDEALSEKVGELMRRFEAI